MKNLFYLFIFAVIGTALFSISVNGYFSRGFIIKEEVKIDTIYVQDSVTFRCIKCKHENIQYLYMIGDTLILNDKMYKKILK